MKSLINALRSEWSFYAAIFVSYNTWLFMAVYNAVPSMLEMSKITSMLILQSLFYIVALARIRNKCFSDRKVHLSEFAWIFAKHFAKVTGCLLIFAVALRVFVAILPFIIELIVSSKIIPVRNIQSLIYISIVLSISFLIFSFVMLMHSGVSYLMINLSSRKSISGSFKLIKNNLKGILTLTSYFLFFVSCYLVIKNPSIGLFGEKWVIMAWTMMCIAQAISIVGVIYISKKIVEANEIKGIDIIPSGRTQVDEDIQIENENVAA